MKTTVRRVNRKALLAGAGNGVSLPRTETLVAVTVPPSTNNLYATIGARRIKSGPYRNWLKYAIGSLVRLKAVSKPARITYTLVGEVGSRTGYIRPDRDLGNIEKPLTDALVKAGVLVNDNLWFVHEITLRFRESESNPPRIEVEVCEL